MSSTSNYSPYSPNYEGLVESFIDLKSTMGDKTAFGIAGFEAEVFENVSQGQPLYSRKSDGKLGVAKRSGTRDEATVAGFAQTSKNTGETARCIILGVLATSGLTVGSQYYLGEGGIVTSTPSVPNQYLTKVGQADTTSSLIVKIQPPIYIP